MILLGSQQSRSAYSPPVGDEYWNDVTLLLNFEGADASTVITDESTQAHTCTANGSFDITTADKMFGNSAGDSNAAGSVSITGTANDGFTGPYTIEGFVKFVGFASIGGASPCLCRFHYGLLLSVTGNILWYNGGTLLTTTNAFSTDTWTHWAQVRNGSDQVEFFINGVSGGAYAGGGGTVDYTAFFFGAYSHAGSGYINGLMDSIRITKGVARYTGNFTPLATAFPTS